MPKKNHLSTTVRSKFHYVIWLIILFFICAVMINVLLVTYLFNFNNNQEEASNDNISDQTSITDNNESESRILGQQETQAISTPTTVQRNFGEQEIQELEELLNKESPINFDDIQIEE